MVLENSSASAPTESIDEIPASDNDPYAAEGDKSAKYFKLDSSNFKPIPIIGPLTGWNEKYFATIMQKKHLSMGKRIGRPLTHEELDAAQYHVGKALSTMSYKSTVATIAGAYRAYNTSSTFRYPFYQPNLETFRPDYISFGSRTLLQGARAITMRHLLRYSAYILVADLFMSPLFVSYAGAVEGFGEMQDPRLKKLNEAVREEFAKRRKQQLPSPAGIPTPSRQQRPQIPQLPQDDASPTGGMMTSEEQANNYEASQSIDWPRTPETNSTPTVQTESSRPAAVQQEEAKPYDLFGEDDASPTGGQGVNSSESGGSAWDKLRRGQKPAEQAPRSRQPSGWGRLQNNTQKEQTEGSTTGGSFSKTEEERSYAKSEAQKEFDARVEKERRGGDFNSGGDEKRW